MEIGVAGARKSGNSIESFRSHSIWLMILEICGIYDKEHQNELLRLVHDFKSVEVIVCHPLRSRMLYMCVQYFMRLNGQLLLKNSYLNLRVQLHVRVCTHIQCMRNAQWPLLINTIWHTIIIQTDKLRAHWRLTNDKIDFLNRQCNPDRPFESTCLI